MGKHQGQNRDGGRGADFRERDRFSAKTKAKDFEQENVLADALRFLFRQSRVAATAFGETQISAKKRLPPSEIPQGYFRVAQALRTNWENETAAGEESRGFGKAMLDKTKAWASAAKADPEACNSQLESLIAETGYTATPDDLLKKSADVA